MKHLRVLLAAAALVLAGCAAPLVYGDEPPPNTNEVAYWCPNGGEKFEPITNPFIVPPGNWTLLVIKGGSGPDENFVVTNPVVGQGYSHPTAGNSHAILCYPATTTTTSTTTSTTSTTAAPTTTTLPPTTTTLPPTTTTGVPTTTTTSPPTTTTTTTTSPPTTTSTTTTTTTAAPTTSSSTLPPPTPSFFSVGGVGTSCSSDVPYIDITFGQRTDLNGDTGTLTFRDLNGVVVDTEPFTYQAGATIRVLYPGATIDANGNPTDWPGWVLNSSGFWVPDATDAAWRDGLTITATIGTETAGPVSITYPPETATCSANPDGPFPPGATTTTAPAVTTTTAPVVTTTLVPPTPNTFAVTPTTTTTQVPVTTPGSLPKTGSDSMPLIVLASGLVLVGGVLMATRRKA